MSKAAVGQLICVVILGIFIALSFFGEGPTEKTAAEIGEAITAKISTEGLQSFDEERLYSQFGLQADSFEGFAYYGSEDIMDVREILVLKEKDETELDKASELIEKKAQEKYNTYKDYDPLAASLLEKRVLENKRGVIIYIVDENASAGLEAFSQITEN